MSQILKLELQDFSEFQPEIYSRRINKIRHIKHRLTEISKIRSVVRLTDMTLEKYPQSITMISFMFIRYDQIQEHFQIESTYLS